ncbi:MAG: toxin-antitoxin system YwqK family antitoxin [Fibrobacterota bacterium]|nr:toxin-antitoxin system YwqK family antitoxin [Fibrobacterota bacterium]
MDYSVCPGPIRILSKSASRAMMALCLAITALVLIPAHGADLRKKEINYPDGKLKEQYSYYLDDKKQEVRDGLGEEFFNTGTKKGEIPWQDGKENGPVIYFYADGRKSYEATYKDGKKNGYATVWYQDGQKQWQTVFREGLTHGAWREWYADGKKKFEANYSEGKLDGLATWWHENGRLWQERSFQSGSLVKGTVREWDRAGKPTFPASDGGARGNESAVSRDSGNGDSMDSGNSPAGN